MSNTSLKPITIPKLNTPDFGKSMMEAFENISLNFQKLSNLGVNKGAPGRSCVYIPINLGAAFVYNPYTTNDRDYAKYYNMSERWLNKVNRELANNDKWKEYTAAVKRDFDQFANATGYDEHEYARIACMLIWGNPFMFGFNSDSNRVVASPSSLAGALHTKYKLVEGSAHIENAEGPVLYGNWLYELNTLANTTDVVDKYFDIFLTHWDISPVGKLIVAFSPDSEYNTLQPVGSFEYWYIDPRYRCGKEVIGDSAIRDISCVLRWESDDFTPGPETRWGGSFEILEIFPSIQVGKDGKYYWYINGLSTGIPVQGNPGKDGSAGRFVIVERVENVTGWHPTEYPNGQNYASPKFGRQVITVPTFSGVPSRVLTGYQKRLADNIQILSGKTLATVDKTFTTEYDLAESATGRISQFVHNETNAWLPATYNAELENISNIAYLHRIFRIIGREKFWKYPADHEVKVDPIDDEWDRMGDPSCDYFYFGQEGVSTINDSQAAQDLMKELDGAAAIVLPGPAYQHDRTDTSFWFATLRLVKVADDNYMLVAYCTPHAQQTTQLDEHSQLGMMMGFDAYAHKSVSDNRNKPRGLVLPIGSVAVASETPSDTWAAHIIHSDAGGFDARYGNGDDCRGKQHTPDDNRVYDSDMPLAPDNRAGATAISPLTQFSHLIKKRILHIGSVDDVRTLNYIENSTSGGAINGAVPGRRPRNNELGPISPVGSSNFFGQREGNWFFGSELHVDEPVTITRYRDLKPKGRLLDVEGDVVIGPHQHKNIPAFRYRNNAGGLWVASTLSSETLDSMLYGNGESIFSKEFVNGGIKDGTWNVLLGFEPFIRTRDELTSLQDTNVTDDVSKYRWNSYVGRWKGIRAIYTHDDNDLNRDQIPANDNPLFSALFDDTIGARMMIAEDGFAIYNPEASLGDKGNVHVPFSVDAMGNIQTYGREIRSNSIDTLWVFHSKWTNDIANNPNTFGPPTGHNSLLFAMSHMINFAAFNTNDNRQNFWTNPNIEGINYLSTDACGLPLGYYNVFGFADENGEHRTTFPHLESQNPYSWHASHYAPTALSIPTDFMWVWGGMLSTGVNPRAFTHDFDGDTYDMRFGGTLKYGLVIPEAARRPVGKSATEAPLNHDSYIADELEVKFRGDQSIIDIEDTNSDPNKKDPTSFGYTEMFADESPNMLNTPVGLWVMQGAVIEKSMIVGGELVGYKSSSVRGQSRATSFRRHKNALDRGSDWAFMLDDGKSSYPAPKHNILGCTCIDNGFRYNQQTPLVLDLGEIYGTSRLVRFGSAGKVGIDADGKLLVEPNGEDGEICLLGRFPNNYKVSSGYFDELFDGKGFNAGRWTMFSDGHIATITVEILLNYRSKVGSHRTWFHGNDQYCAYGIAVYNKKGGLDYNSEPGSYKMLINTPTKVNFNIDNDYLPAMPVDVHIQALKHTHVSEGKTGGSIGHGSAAASWGHDGRDSQYGITFRLNTDGKLVIARASGAALMVAENHEQVAEDKDDSTKLGSNQSLSFTFTYPLKKVLGKIPDLNGNSDGVEPANTYEIVFMLGPDVVLKKAEVKDDEGNVIDNPLDVSQGLPWTGTVIGTIQSDGKLAQDVISNLDDDEMIAKLQSGTCGAIVTASITTGSLSIDKPYTEWTNAEIKSLEWSIYATADDIKGSEGYAKRYVCTTDSFGGGSNISTSKFAGKATNGDFLSHDIGVGGTVPGGAVENSYDLTVEKAGGMNIVTLRVAIDRVQQCSQNAWVAGIKFGDLFDSKFEYRNLPTHARLDQVDSSLKGPKYDLLYYWPGLKAVKTSERGSWTSGNTKGKGVAGDGDKQDQHGIVLALKPTGEIEVVRTVNPCSLCDPRDYSLNGDQPYMMARWIYPEDDDATGLGLITNRLYGTTTKFDGVTNDTERNNLKLSPIQATSTNKYVWVKTVKVGKTITDTDDKLWDNAKWELFSSYSDMGVGDGNDMDDDGPIDDGLVTQVFGGSYGDSLGYIVQSNGSLSHATHTSSSAFDEGCKKVLEGVFRQAANYGADVRDIGTRTKAAWMTFNLSNCTMKIGYQVAGYLLGIIEFYSSPAGGNDGAAFRKETGKVKIDGTFTAGENITVTNITMSSVKTEDFA